MPHVALLKKSAEVCAGLTNQHIELHQKSTSTLLANASILSKYVYNWHVKSVDLDNSSNMKKIYRISDQKNVLWKTSLNQEWRNEYYKDLLNYSNVLKNINLTKTKFDQSYDSFSLIDKNLKLLNILSCFYLRKNTYFLHPENTIQSALHENEWKIKGFCIKIKGPRSGTKALTLKHGYGKYSTNNVGITVFDSYVQHIPGKIGTFGFRISIVYDYFKLCPNYLSVFNDGFFSYLPFK